MFKIRSTVVVAMITIALALVLGARSGYAAPPTPIHKQLNASQCNSGSTPIVNVTFNVLNDFDSGVAGNWWAVDSYNKQIQIWAQDDGTFCAVVKYEGQFVTLAGTSPGNTGTVAADIQGNFNGGYVGVFTGTFAPTRTVNGNIGTFDYHCQTTCDYFSWLDAYFTGVTGFDQPFWAWYYRTPANGNWLNANTGNLEDITGIP